jgi:hypothetical protein
MIFGKLAHMPEVIPIVMFGWLALNLIATWHKGAMLRAALRGWNAEPAPAAALRQRVQVDKARQQVRVHTSDLHPDEVVASTEVQEPAESARRRAP